MHGCSMELVFVARASCGGGDAGDDALDDVRSWW